MAGALALSRPVNTATLVQGVVAMSEPHSTVPVVADKPVKPSKPYPEFPLTAHPAGYWCKKIRGKLHYFGAWADPDGALAKYLEQETPCMRDVNPARTRTPRRSKTWPTRTFTKSRLS